MINIQPYREGECWWCGKPANSKEHRHKKSDIKHIFGNRFESEPVLIRGNHKKTIQGPDSKLLKFEKVLCQNCNNSRSQPFDRSYDLFINYVLENYELILDKKNINLVNIVNSDTIGFKHNIFRYLTKIFCCRLATNNIIIEPKLVEFLNYAKPLDFMYFKFEVRPDIHAFLNRPEADVNDGNIYLSPLKYFLSKDNNQINLVYQFYNLQWLRIYTFYSEKMTEENYSGYNEYNNSNTILIEAKYSVNPDNLFDRRIDVKPKVQDENKWIEEYLNTNTFKN
ncbi:MAG: hypothetical protein GQ564_07975 [Bacteroidales bacterium]|nr:hypothetical protein [Bacteroidales bacterium]